MQYRYSSSYGFNSGLLTPVVRALLILTVAVYFFQVLVDGASGMRFTAHFSLSLMGIRRLGFWQPLTYMFLHGGFLHLLINMLGLFFFGPETERALGSKRFAGLYLGCGIAAGLGWLMISGLSSGYCVGASGAVFGILGAFAGLFPDRPVTLLVFFVIPVTLRARMLALGLGLFNLLALISQPGQIAYAAHLAGGLAGFIYARVVTQAGRPVFFWNPRQWWNDCLWRWQRRKFKVIRGAPDDDDRQPPTDAEVDAVLDKVARFGFGGLTPRERDILARASRRT